MNVMKQNLLSSVVCGGLIAFAAAPLMVSAQSKDVEQEIEIIKEGSGDANVTVTENGNTTSLTLSDEALKDKAVLEQELANLPEETRNMVMKALGNVAVIGDANAHVLHLKGDHNENTFEWSSEDEGVKKVIVVDTISETGGENNDIKIIKKMVHADGDAGHPVFISANGEGGAAKAIVHLLEKAELSPEELDQIQQALDAKR
ncbi:hypothetical protein [Thalassotalea mangrovi]|uniref:Uncharacterized protein n=1 Tax=Thalassotalea mangrovi TaxID=2572245 RepID=A0A4V5NUK7_9GAMM|nr:hypothetical protein [Thalassotalea mangrovi]TKB45814.1 hypothetical protein E8M12_06080 [Thalassotalea mangrovi]